jgi:hypothetical protein
MVLWSVYVIWDGKPGIVGYSESMSLFPEPHMDDLHHLLGHSQFPPDGLG